MAHSFLDDLPISDAERQALRALGARRAASLAHMIAANREGFRTLIGNEARAAAIERDVVAMLSGEERAQLDAPAAPPRFALGARLTPPDEDET
ncbi:MAG TPA: hypothetical protein VKI43_03365 [Vicinamibacterales bacterium]|nr:hypothetical protein [Vicinamibacterales bacterium]